MPVPALALLLGAACRMSGDFAGSSYKCDDGAACPTGFRCAGGWCLDVLAPDGPGDPPADAPPPDGPLEDTAPDGPGLDAPPPGTCDWAAGPAFGPVVLVDELASARHEFDLFVSSDGLTAHLSTDRQGGAGQADIWLATRATASVPFAVQGPLVALNSPQDDGWAHLSTDGLEVLFHSDRSGEFDLLSATRASTAEAFAAPQRRADLSTAGEEWDPSLSADGLTVYFSGGGSPPLGDGRYHIVAAHRTDRASPFGTAKLVPGLASYGSDDAGPALTSDERVIVWHSARPGGQGLLDLWYATRADRSQAFGTALPLAALNTSAVDWKPFLRADGCELWFSSNRPGGAGGYDVYRLELQPP